MVTARMMWIGEEWLIRNWLNQSSWVDCRIVGCAATVLDGKECVFAKDCEEGNEWCGVAWW